MDVLIMYPSTFLLTQMVAEQESGLLLELTWRFSSNQQVTRKRFQGLVRCAQQPENALRLQRYCQEMASSGPGQVYRQEAGRDYRGGKT